MKSRMHIHTGAARTALAELRRYREAQGITQVVAAERCGMGRANYQRVEVGPTGNPSFDCVAKMANAVGLRVVLVPIDNPELDVDELRVIARLVRWYLERPGQRAVPAVLLSAFRKIAPYAVEVVKK